MAGIKCDSCEISGNCSAEANVRLISIAGRGEVEISCNYMKQDSTKKNNFDRKENITMKVKRTIETKCDISDLQVGDNIVVVKATEEHPDYTATVMEIVSDPNSTEEKIILFMDTSIAERRIHRTDCKHFNGSEISDWLNEDFWNTMRKKIRKCCEEVRLPYVKELFDRSELDNWDLQHIDFSEDNHKKWSQMDRKERAIGYAYWCMNPVDKNNVSASAFAIVYSTGLTNYNSACYDNGVRPVLVLVRSAAKKEKEDELVKKPCPYCCK